MSILSDLRELQDAVGELLVRPQATMPDRLNISSARLRGSIHATSGELDDLTIGGTLTMGTGSEVNLTAAGQITWGDGDYLDSSGMHFLLGATETTNQIDWTRSGYTYLGYLSGYIATTQAFLRLRAQKDTDDYAELTMNRASTSAIASLKVTLAGVDSWLNVEGDLFYVALAGTEIINVTSTNFFCDGINLYLGSTSADAHSAAITLRRGSGASDIARLLFMEAGTAYWAVEMDSGQTTVFEIIHYAGAAWRDIATFNVSSSPALYTIKPLPDQSLTVLLDQPTTGLNVVLQLDRFAAAAADDAYVAWSTAGTIYWIAGMISALDTSWTLRYTTSENMIDVNRIGASQARVTLHTLRATKYEVGATPGANFNGAVTNLTVVDGLVTAAS